VGLDGEDETQGTGGATSMTTEQLDEWERLERAATPAPWGAKEIEDDCIGCASICYSVLTDADGDLVEGDDDYLLAAKARNILPKLIAKVRRLQEENRILRGTTTTAVPGSLEHARFFRQSMADYSGGDNLSPTEGAIAPEDAATEAALDRLSSIGNRDGVYDEDF
jgi:hypothetical protein